MVDAGVEVDPPGVLEELAELPAGPGLADTLAGIDRSTLGADDLLRLAQARQRLIAHQEAQLLADLHAVARAIPDQGPQPGRRDQPGKYPWAEVEAALALRWTYGRAAAQLAFADEVIDRLPAVHTALTAGQIDIPKARVITEAVGCLEQQPARGIVDKVLHKAPGQTTGELRARLRRLVLAADAGAAAARARRDNTDRRVAAYPHPDNHLATLAGYDLAPHRVAAAMERLEAIARAAKAAGDPRRIDQLRADAYLDLIAGEGVAAGGPISNGALDGNPVAIGAGPPEPATPWPAGPADPTLLTDPTSDPVTVPPADPDPDVWAAGAGEPPHPADGGLDPDQERLRRELAGFAHLPTTRPTNTTQAAGGVGVMPGPRRGVVELQVPLTTLLGLSQLPGELDRWGPVVADLTRQITAGMTGATWRYSVYDTLGELAHHGTTRARPTPQNTGRDPTAEQAAYVAARDRRCVAPGCRRTAGTCDLDHTIAWAHDGPTEPANLGLLCRTHHLFKHATGTQLLQITSGVFAWKTPAGLCYGSTPDTPLIDDNDLAGILPPPPEITARAGDLTPHDLIGASDPGG